MKVANSNVLIAGAGPVGLAVAADLARYGVSVRLIEKSPERTDKSKALVLWSRTLLSTAETSPRNFSCRNARALASIS